MDYNYIIVKQKFVFITEVLLVIFMMKIFLALSIFLFSCTPSIKYENNFTKIEKVNIKNSSIGSVINLKILNPKNFNTKVTINGSLAKKSTDVKSFKVWLCTNPLLPVTSVLSGSQFDFDKVITDEYSWVDFINVPSGGPYYAVISAYDDLVVNTVRKNITKENIFSTDGKQKISISTNSITVNPDFTLTPLDTLKVNLSLVDAIGNSIETKISPQDGGNGIFGVN